MYDDGPGDDYMTTEQAFDAGWLGPEDADEIRELIAKVDLTTPRPGDRALAVLVMLDYKLNATAEVVMSPPDPTLIWARSLLYPGSEITTR